MILPADNRDNIKVNAVEGATIMTPDGTIIAGNDGIFQLSGNPAAPRGANDPYLELAFEDGSLTVSVFNGTATMSKAYACTVKLSNAFLNYNGNTYTMDTIHFDANGVIADHGQQVAVRPNGAAGNTPDFNYAAKYTDHGISFQNNAEAGTAVISVDKTTLDSKVSSVAYDAYANSDLKKLVGGDTGVVYLGLQYTAPVDGATQVVVSGFYSEDKTQDLDIVEDPSGISGWDGTLLLYHPIASLNVPTDSGNVSVAEMKTADHDITLTWKDAEGNIIAVTAVSITNNVTNAG